jgi:hypothetical protein
MSNKFAQCRLIAISLMALSVSACIEPKTRCETFDYDGNRIVLAVPSTYLALTGSHKGGVSLRFRYRDLASMKGWNEGFDQDEFNDPNWTLEKSNYVALLQIDRIGLVWPQRIDDFKQSYPSLREVPSDWEGWTKLEICPRTCNERYYLNAAWRDAGVAHVMCYEAEWRDPKYISCSARDNINGLHVTYFFPTKEKAHFAEFRAKVTELIERMAKDAKSACPVKE